MAINMVRRRFSAEAASFSGDSRFGGQGTVFLHPQSQFPKKPPNHPNPDGPFSAETPKSATHLLSDFDRMLRSEKSPSIFEFCRVLTTLSRMGHHSKVVSLHREMGLNHVPVDLFTLNVVINSCCRLGNDFGVGYGFSVYGAIVKNGFEPDAVTFTHLIKGLFLEGRGNHALRLFQKSTKVCKPDLVSYATVIDGLCKMGNVDMAIRLFRDMKGGRCEPDTAIYNSICDGLCKIKRFDVALSLTGEMVKMGLSLDCFTFSTLIKGLFLKGESNEALKLVRKLLRALNGVQPNFITYGIVIDGLCKMGNVVAAVDLFRYMSGSYNLNAEIYTTIIDGLCKNKRVELAFSFVGEMVKKGCMPNLVTFTTLINGLFLHCEPNSALRLFNKLTKAEKIYQPDKFTYGIVVDGLCKLGDVDTAISLFRDMERGNCKPNTEIYTTIIDGLVKKRRVDEASGLLDEMVMNGVMPDIVTYNVMINGYCMVGKLNEARELFIQLSGKNIHLDVFTYNIMINGLCQEGFLEEAKQWLLKMEESGCKPDEVTYRTIVSGFSKWNGTHEVLDIIHRMVEMKLSPRSSSLSKAAGFAGS